MTMMLMVLMFSVGIDVETVQNMHNDNGLTMTMILMSSGQLFRHPVLDTKLSDRR